MATISTLVNTGTTHQSRGGNTVVPYKIENYIDLAEVAVEKGSAIAAADVIQALHVPAGTQVLFAGLQVVEAMTGTSMDATLDFGITGGDVDAWVDGFDLDAAAAGAYAAPALASVTPANFFATADTLDLLVATQTGTITGGVLRVFAVVVDLSDRVKKAEIAQIGS